MGGATRARAQPWAAPSSPRLARATLDLQGSLGGINEVKELVKTQIHLQSCLTILKRQNRDGEVWKTQGVPEAAVGAGTGHKRLGGDFLERDSGRLGWDCGGLGDSASVRTQRKAHRQG